ncbi:MAG: S-adenosyl-l-methionine hydroxide adenosyltransferase family protein [Terriglobia bacterium]
MPRKQVVTLITDFGHNDHFVGVMKGVILGINPEALIVDVCHQVNSYDIFDAAFVLAQSYRFFPSDTIHLVVVDPGVGTARRPLLARTMEHKFIAPDNGVLSLVYEREESVEVRHVTSDHYFLNPVSNTFHGRDVFAPIAGWLSKGLEVDKFGEPIEDYAKFTSPKPKKVSDQLVKGVVIRIDKFGNITTNITPEDIPQLFQETPPPFKILIGQLEVTKLNLAYAMGKPSELFAIVGSSGFIEVCTNRGSAAKAMNVNRGAEVGVMLG